MFFFEEKDLLRGKIAQNNIISRKDERSVTSWRIFSRYNKIWRDLIRSFKLVLHNCKMLTN